jgi:hypothetical protein
MVYGRTKVYADLDRKVSSIYVISQEEIAGIRWVATDFKQLHEVELR